MVWCIATSIVIMLNYVCLALPWSLSSARSRRGASWWTSSSVLSTPAGCVPWPESQRRICRSTLRCYHSSSFSACPFFDCLRLFPVVLLWIGRPILSRAHTISVYAALRLPGDLRTVLYALRWFPAHARLWLGLCRRCQVSFGSI